MLVYAGRLGWGRVVSCWGETALEVGGRGVPFWLAALLAILIGGVLSVMAALYPAWRAAKMPPAAALRSEF
jgi:hypothetical protein